MNVSRSILAVLVVTLVAAAACRSSAGEGSTTAARQTDWSGFSSKNNNGSIEPGRAIPETPIQINGAEYVKAVQLSWSEADIVPTYVPENVSLKLPASCRQAVLLVTIVKLPASSNLRVSWFYEGSPVFDDGLDSRVDGDHYFSLINRDGKRLAPLPPGNYRADVVDGSQLIKSITFQVTSQGARS